MIFPTELINVLNVNDCHICHHLVIIIIQTFSLRFINCLFIVLLALSVSNANLPFFQYFIISHFYVIQLAHIEIYKKDQRGKYQYLFFAAGAGSLCFSNFPSNMYHFFSFFVLVMKICCVEIH